jgi:diguanylate cyclase (GGDEF)-like protein
MLLASSVAVVAISGITAIGWYYPAITIVFFLLPLNIALAFVIVSTIFLTIVTATMVEIDVWLPLITSIGLCCLSTYFIFSCYRKVEIELRKQVDKDYLTQVGNRSTFDRDIKLAADLSTRKRDLTVLVMLDLDNFKAVNDTFGHLSGDAVLTQTAKCLVNSIRKDDSVYRYGGEEFAILFRNTNLEDALRAAEKVRSNIESTIFPVNRTVTVSLGLGLYESRESLNNWIKRVDLALYKAKNTGKNKAVLADSTNYHEMQDVCNN